MLRDEPRRERPGRDVAGRPADRVGRVGKAEARAGALRPPGLHRHMPGLDARRLRTVSDGPAVPFYMGTQNFPKNCVLQTFWTVSGFRKTAKKPVLQVKDKIMLSLTAMKLEVEL